MIAVQSIHPSSYYQPSIFEQEQRHVFEKNWIFAGFKDQVINNNDYITVQIGTTPVVIQNFKGEINALLNICSHRKAKLQTASHGNNPLVCPYHCWSYKKNGDLAGIPQNKTDFGLDEQAKKSLALRRFDLAICGNLIFVRIIKQQESLEEFLGPYFAILQHISTEFTDPVQDGHYQWQTNWKIACETVLEVYHVAGIHPETFAKFAIAECDVEHFNGHSTGHTPLQDAPKHWWKKARKLLKLTQNETYSEYNHFFIYPNLAIGLTNGSLMSLQTYEPMGPSQSRLNFNLRMMPRTDGSHSSDVIKAAVQLNFTQFNHTILEEDRVVAESCQGNMPLTNTPGLLGKCEDRIKHFHNAWRQDITEITEGQ